jgi:transposase-like protein
LSIYEPAKGYSNHIKRECIELYLNGMGFRAIERVKGVHHTTIIYWVKQLGGRLPDTPVQSNIPEVTELDELQTFVRSKKKQNLAVDRGQPLHFRHSRLGLRRSQRRDIQAIVADCRVLAQLLLRH